MNVLPDAAAAVLAVAEYTAALARAAVEARGAFRIAVGGGSTPRALYRLLASEFRARIPWEHAELFVGDERCVPLDDPASNFGMVRDLLLAELDVGVAHPVQTELSPDEAAARYAEVLGDEPLDLALQGMGEDGHTASLFPGAALETDRRVVHTQSPVPPHDRVSLTLRALNEARAVAFLVTGAAKAARLAVVQAEVEAGQPGLPATRVRSAGDLRWVVDRAAAGSLR